MKQAPDSLIKAYSDKFSNSSKSVLNFPFVTPSIYYDITFMGVGGRPKYITVMGSAPKRYNVIYEQKRKET